jgi:predicted aminopeptidase
LTEKKYEFNSSSLNAKTERPFIFFNNFASPSCRSKPKFSMMKCASWRGYWW